MTDRVEVTGFGSVDEVPDVLAAALSAEAASGSVAAALATADTAFRAMAAAARDGGTADRDIRTTGLTVHPDHDHQGRQSGFVARMTMSLVLRDLSTAGDVLAAVVEAGGDHSRVQGAALGMDDPLPAQVAAREKAFAHAHAQAEQLASLAGRTLGAVLRVTDGTTPAHPGGWEQQGALPMRAFLKALSFEPGTSTVTATVGVRFALD
jgi:uncharacterized protein YggE